MSEENKIWWQSRTVWTGIVGLVFAFLASFKVIPPELTQDQVVEVILGVISVFAIIFRVAATKTVAVKK